MYSTVFNCSYIARRGFITGHLSICKCSIKLGYMKAD